MTGFAVNLGDRPFYVTEREVQSLNWEHLVTVIDDVCDRRVDDFLDRYRSAELSASEIIENFPYNHADTRKYRRAIYHYKNLLIEAKSKDKKKIKEIRENNRSSALETAAKTGITCLFLMTYFFNPCLGAMGSAVGFGGGFCYRENKINEAIAYEGSLNRKQWLIQVDQLEKIRLSGGND